MKLKIKKSLALTLLIAVLIGLTYPLYQAQAQFDWMFAPLEWLGKFATKVGVGVGVSWLVLKMSQGILAWVASADFMIESFTHNEFVTIGWGIVRDFVNMFFILILVAIGIATALRIRGYEIKKTIPRLIAIALLINFTPVICGVIIDASNIIMNFFFSAGAEGFSRTLNLTSVSGSGIVEAFRGAWQHPMQLFNGTLFFKAIALLAFNLIASFIVLVIALLLLVRYVALWILVILSPLAFFAFILPATKKIWNMWWNQFIQWCFIGIGAGFFLYLTQLLLDNTDIFTAPSATGTGLGPTLVNILVQSVPLMFLGAGYFVITSSSAMGAKILVGFAQKGARWTKGKAGKRVMGALKKDTQKAVEPYKQIMGKWATRIAKKEPKKFWGASAGQKIALPYHWARQRAAKRVLGVTTGGETAEIEKLKEEYKKLTGEGRTLQVRTAKTRTERIAATLAKIEEGEADDLTPEEMKGAIEKAGGIHKDLAKKISRGTPHIAIEMAENLLGEASRAKTRGKDKEAKKIMRRMEQMDLLLTPDDTAKGYKTLGDKLAGGINPKNIPSISADAFKNQEFLAGVMKLWGGNKAATAGRELGRAATDEIQKGIDEMGDKLKTENFSLYKFSTGNAGAAIGLGPADPSRIKAGEPTLATARGYAESKQEKYSELSEWMKEGRKEKKKKRKRIYVDRD